MAEDLQGTKDIPVPRSEGPGPRGGRGDTSSGRVQIPTIPAHPPRVMWQQQRQKCELRRLLKHTHPELKTMDGVMDEELAELLSLETAGENGYEGEVLSRRQMFENCAVSYSTTEKGPAEREEVVRTSAQIDEDCTKVQMEVDEGPRGPDPNSEGEEQMVRVDVQSARKMFENFERQSVVTSWSSPKKLNDKSRDATGQVQNRKTKNAKCKLEHTCEIQGSARVNELLQTSASLIQNNPFISTNMEREQSHKANSQINNTPNGDPNEAGRATEDSLRANVKNRAQLFNVMPFDKIQHQNKEEIESIVERITQTLQSLFRLSAIHSHGSIIEVNETMLAKKAKYHLSQTGPRVNVEDVAEGGAQNFILQLLPRAKLKTQVIHMKEDNQGNVESTVVDSPVYQRQFSPHQDVEFKTANVVQLVEDMLIQDNSVSKGVVIQEDQKGYSDVTVYSLYNHTDGGMRSVCPPPGRSTMQTREQPTRFHDIKKGEGESTTSCLLASDEDRVVTESSQKKGNVKLFRNCIEKGDYEYLKTLKADPTEQEPSGVHAENDGSSQQGRVEINAQPNSLSANHSCVRQTPLTHDDDRSNIMHGERTSLDICYSGTSSGQVPNMLNGCSTQEQQKIRDCRTEPRGSALHANGPGQDVIVQAELVEAGDDEDEISILQAAIHSLRQATIDAKALLAKEQALGQLALRQPLTCSEESDLKNAEMQPGMSLKNKQGEKIFCQREPPTSESSTAIKHESEQQQNHMTSADPLSQEEHFADAVADRTSVDLRRDSVESMPVQSSATKSQEEESDMVGSLQAALDSLAMSSVNVSRGDFRAAMIYRASSNSPQKTMQNVEEVSSNNVTKIQLGSSTQSHPEPCETLSTVAVVMATEDEHRVNANLAGPAKITEDPEKHSTSKNHKRPVGPKPAVPPKPEHLKVERNAVQPAGRRHHRDDAENSTLVADIRKQCKEEQPPGGSMPNGGVAWMGGSVTGTDVNSSISKSGKHELIEASVGPNLETQHSVELDNREVDEEKIDFQESLKKFGKVVEISVKTAPAKPKRSRAKQNAGKIPKQTFREHVEPKLNTTHQSGSESNNCKPILNNSVTNGERKPESHVVMREKKHKKETEQERRLRLSVHMDQIVRGNTTTAMEILDHLRKQEQLWDILHTVEEIEQDTSDVDVGALRAVFENVPAWVVGPKHMKEKPETVQRLVEKPLLIKHEAETVSSMAHVFGDLEKASEEVMNLKAQTLARLVDIEEAIKKALYSVSALKSDSDIAGLSDLLKESLGKAHGSTTPNNIRKISIGSSKRKTHEKAFLIVARDKGASRDQSSDPASGTQRASPPCSPAFISIESAVRKNDDDLHGQAAVCPTCLHSPATPETSRTNATLRGGSPAHDGHGDSRKGVRRQKSGLSRCPSEGPSTPHRKISVIELQSDAQGTTVAGTKTVTEEYETKDQLGNQFYSTRTSTVVTSEPDPMTSVGRTIPAHQVTTYPEFQPASQDMCSACLKPVYPMEKIMADNHVFHRSCFCCKHCKKTLSMQSYTPHLGSHYCISHYQQLFKRRGNYDEGFGHAQHKSRWLPGAAVDESEA